MKIKEIQHFLSKYAVLSLIIFLGTSVEALANIPPVADAGPNISISISDVPTTVIQGIVTDPDNAGFFKCLWEDQFGNQVSGVIQEVGPNGECPLVLNGYFHSGLYTLTIWGWDGELLAADFMLLTITNTPPIVDAGPDISISISDVPTTVIQGTVTDPDNTGFFKCLWEDQFGNQVSGVIQEVGPNGECPLVLNDSFQTGLYTLTIWGWDGELLAADSMLLTITNTPPIVDAGPDISISISDVQTTVIQGTVTDPDNTGFLKCLWEDQFGNQVSGVIQEVGPNGECPLVLSDSFQSGLYTLTIWGWDGELLAADSMLLTIITHPPLADAGPNVTITTSEVATTVIQGNATDEDSDLLQYRWMEGLNTIQNWTPVGPNGECPLDLNTLSLGIGAYTFFLAVNDGLITTIDEVILSIENSAPHASPGGGGVYEVNTDIFLVGDVSDIDGDPLNYQWIEGSNVFCSGSIQAVSGGSPVLLPDCVVSNMSLGTHTISLQTYDGLNIPDSSSISVEIVDSTAPTIAPVANKYLLWPPNHRMVDIAIAANATDNNSGCPISLNAIVTGNDFQYSLGDDVDWTQPVIDQTTGIIYLQLRAERSGCGKGRVYTVKITATDCSGNISTAKVKISVPHDKDNDDRKREDREEHNRHGRHDRDDRDDRDDRHDRHD